MGTSAIGQVVMVSFPYSNLQGAKKRPALILREAGRGDWLLCQITSQAFGDPHIVALHQSDFASGTLSLLSYARPLKLFTAHESLFQKQVALLGATKLAEVRQQLTHLLSS